MVKKKRFPGGSGSSNPTTQKYRQQAKEKLGRQKNTGAGALTQEALMRHNATQEDVQMDAESHHPAASIAASTVYGEMPAEELMKSIFAKVERYYASSLPAHQEACAVLAAITESIHAKPGAKETPSTYWAALMSALETGLASQDEDDQESASAILFLLSLVTPHAGSSMLRLKHAHAFDVLGRAIEMHKDEPGTSLVKSAVTCYEAILMKLSDSEWADIPAREAFQLLVGQCIQPKAKVRRAAQAAVKHIIHRLHEKKIASPAPALLADFCHMVLTKVGQDAEIQTAKQHMLTLLKSVLPYLPSDKISAIGTAILSLLRKGHPITRLLCIAALDGLFVADNVQPLSSTFVVSLLEALHEHRPAVSDAAPRCEWNSTITHGTCLAVQKHAMATSADLIKAAAEEMLEGIAEGRNDVASSASKCLANLVGGVIPTLVAGVKAKEMASKIKIVVATLEKGLAYRFQRKLPQVLVAVSELFKVLGSHGKIMASSVLRTLAELHETKGVFAKSEIEQTLGAAVKAMGPRDFVSVLPLSDLQAPELRETFQNAWMLPLLKDNISNTEIAVFGKHFLPMATHMEAQRDKAAAAGKEYHAKTYDTLYNQLWNLLPGFCDHAVDVVDSFKKLAKTLGMNLETKPVLRLVICKALQNAIKTSDEEGRKAVAVFAKNFMPILFNISSQPDIGDELRSNLLNTIKEFAGIADPALVNTFFKDVAKRLLEASTADDESSDAQQRQHAMMDLALALVPHLDAQALALLYRLVAPQIQVDDATLQKKSYRALSMALDCESEHHQAFFQQHVSDLMQLLGESLMTVKSAAKLPRLRCISSVINLLQGPQLGEFVQQIGAEVILGTKEVNERARTTAYDLLTNMGMKLQQQAEAGNSPMGLEGYVSFLLAGLAGTTPHMISAAVLSISSVLFRFRNDISLDLRNQIMEAMLVLCQSKAREILKAVLGFIKVSFAALPQEQLDARLPDVVQALTSMRHEDKHHFKSKIRVLVERLCRKFGYDRVEQLFPEDDRKLITHIRRQKERQKRKKLDAKQQRDANEAEHQAGNARYTTDAFQALLEDDDASDSEGSVTEGNEGKRKRKGARRAVDDDMWIHEGDEGLVDLLDPAAIHNVRSTAPARKSKRVSKDDGFAVTDDGKLLIDDSDEDDADIDAKARGKRRGADAMVVDDYEDSDDDAPRGLTMGRGIHRDRQVKRKGRDDDDDDDDDGKSASWSKKDDKIGRKAGAAGDLGAKFRSKRAAGDVKRKGVDVQPYAYVPLDPQHLNKRKRAKAVDKFVKSIKHTKKAAAEHRQRTKRRKSNK